MPSPARFLIDDEPLGDFNVRPGAGVDDVLLLVDACVARPRSALRRNALAITAAMLLGLVALGLTLIGSGRSAVVTHVERSAPIEEAPAVVVGSSRAEAMNGRRSDDRTR